MSTDVTPPPTACCVCGGGNRWWCCWRGGDAESGDRPPQFCHVISSPLSCVVHDDARLSGLCMRSGERAQAALVGDGCWLTRRRKAKSMMPHSAMPANPTARWLHEKRPSNVEPPPDNDATTEPPCNGVSMGGAPSSASVAEAAPASNPVPHRRHEATQASASSAVSASLYP